MADLLQPRVHPCGALLAHAGRQPEAPWLFFQQHGHWRWSSFAEAARLAGEFSRWLGDVAPGSRVGFAAWCDPWSVLLDLAILGAGRVSLPIRPDTPAGELSAVLVERRCDLWLDRRGAELTPAADAAIERRLLPEVEIGGKVKSERLRVEEAPEPGWGAVGVESAAAGYREMPLSVVIDASRALEDRLSRRRREVLVHGRALSSAGERLVVTWATLAGAALVLEPWPDGVAGTVFWARPTVLHGDRESLAGLGENLRALAGNDPRRRLRRQLGRLWRVVVEGEAPPAVETELWRAIGAEIVALEVPASGVETAVELELDADGEDPALR